MGQVAFPWFALCWFHLTPCEPGSKPWNTYEKAQLPWRAQRKLLCGTSQKVFLIHILNTDWRQLGSIQSDPPKHFLVVWNTPIKVTTGICPKDQDFDSRKPWLLYIVHVWCQVLMVRFLEEGTRSGESATDGWDTCSSVVDMCGFYLFASKSLFLWRYYLSFPFRSNPHLHS